MFRDRRSAHVALSLFALGLVGAGCSILNSFDALDPQKDAGPDGSPPPPPPEAGLDADAAEAAPPREAGPDAPIEAGPRGAIVIGGTVTDDAGDQYVLTALDPATGSELPQARTPMAVAAVLYDGTRDLWYVFESFGQDLFPLPADPYFTLHVRLLDPVTGAWTEVGSARVPPGLSFATTAVVEQRISYVAYGDATDPDAEVPAAYGLVTLDTSDPAHVAVASVEPLTAAPDAPPVALMGTRLTVNSVGGLVTMGATGAPPAGGSNVAELTPAAITSTGAPTIEQPIFGTSGVGGQTGFGRVRIAGADQVVVVSRGFSGASGATVALFDPRVSDPTTAQIGLGSFSFNDGNVKAPAFSECDQAIFVVGTNSDLNVYAVPFTPALGSDGGPVPLTATSQPTNHSGQGVFFEPYTSTVIAPFSQGTGYALTAFTYSGGQLAIRQAPEWVPPVDLRPNFVATRIPVPFNCTNRGSRSSSGGR